MALLNLCMKFKKIFGQKHSIEALRKWQQEKYSQLVQGSAKSRIYAGKSAKRGFSKKAITRIEFFLLFQVTMNLLKAWNVKLEVASFFMSKILYKQCEICILQLHTDYCISRGYKNSGQLTYSSDFSSIFSNSRWKCASHLSITQQ